jgi:hypothetical protein
MTVNYKGMDSDFDYRLAEINFDDGEYKELDYITKVMKIKGWNIDIVTDRYAQCEVDDKKDYKEFMKDWKEVKKNVALWKKFNIAY